MTDDTMSQLKEYITQVAKNNEAILVGCTNIKKLHSTAIILGFHYSDKSYFKNPFGITKRIYDVNARSNNALAKLSSILKKEHYTSDHKSILSLYGDMRPYIEAANLGVIGRNGLIVNSQYGSNLLFSMLFTDAPFEKENPYHVSFHPCTYCKRCIDACPVNAYENNQFNTYKCFISSIKGCKECVTHCINKNGIVGDVLMPGNIHQLKT